MVDYARWLKKYLTGIETIDRQHRELAESMNTIEQLLGQDSDPDDLIEIVDNLVNYFQKHFAYEEELLKNHPGFEQHRIEHQKFIDKTKEFEREIHVTKSLATASQLLSFLYVWFLSHTLKIDKVQLAEGSPKC